MRLVGTWCSSLAAATAAIASADSTWPTTRSTTAAAVAWTPGRSMIQGSAIASASASASASAFVSAFAIVAGNVGERRMRRCLALDELPRRQGRKGRRLVRPGAEVRVSAAADAHEGDKDEEAAKDNVGAGAGAGAGAGVGWTVGDTRGAALLLQDVSVSRGPNRILTDVEWRIEPKQKWGIVGPNGAGKSTLLGAITGSARIDHGKAMVAPKTRVGYLRQTAVAGKDGHVRTVMEEALSDMHHVNDARRAVDAAAARVADLGGGEPSDAALRALDDATARLERVGGYYQERDVCAVLSGLGFRIPGDVRRPCGDFSGGWQMRIALARLLLSKPTLLLLDEPSNHLDSSARDWLASYLSSYDGTMVLVSHDVSLLQQTVTSIAEISRGSLLCYPQCTYSRYLQEKDFRAKSALAEYERNQAEAARLRAYVDRFGASATKASSAQSRLKSLDRMEKEGKLDAPPEAVVAVRRKPVLVLPHPPKSIGEDLVVLTNADIGHIHPTMDGPMTLTPTLRNVNLSIRRGMKLILRGPNGAGKSTLMSALRGTLPLLRGTRSIGTNLKLGVFTQDLAQELDGSARAVDVATSYARDGPHGNVLVSDQDARDVMGLLQLGGDKPLRRIDELSGGEKARVALSMFALKPSNLLMLDEPSNHLDVECVEALGEALSRWGQGRDGEKNGGYNNGGRDKSGSGNDSGGIGGDRNKKNGSKSTKGRGTHATDGAIVVVSHDRSFCEKVGFTHVGTVKDGTFVLEERGLEERDWDRYDLAAETGTETETEETGTPTSTSTQSGGTTSITDKQEERKRRKMAFNAPKRIAKLERLIEDAEILIANYDEEMMTCGTDVGRLMDITEKKQKEEENVARLMEEWEELEEIVLQYS